MARAVFLDRDGVLNRAVVRDGLPYPPQNMIALEIIPDAVLALNRLRDAGFRLIVVTNQPDVARGTQTREQVEAIHQALQAQLSLTTEDFRVCYHDNADNCSCRKPKPGMLLDAATDFELDLATSFMIGDRWRDIEAGKRAGCKTIFIDYHYAELNRSQPDAIVNSLMDAVDWILRQIGTP